VSLAKVLPLALAPAVAGSVAAVVPVALAAVAGMAAMVPVLGGRDPSLPEAVGVATVWVAASAGAVALAYLTSVGVVLAPPLVVGAAMANDTTPVHKSDDEDPLPLAQLIRDIDNAGDRRTRR
jgi:hypothetical protein